MHVTSTSAGINKRAFTFCEIPSGVANNNWEKIIEELTCAIYQDLLNEPRDLLCLHSFSTGYLKKWLTIVLTSSKESKCQLECPLCKAEVLLSASPAIEQLRPNFSAKYLVEIFHLQEQAGNRKIICQNCNEGDIAVSSCSECAIFLCKFCETAHRRYKATSKHKICALDEIHSSTSPLPFMLPISEATTNGTSSQLPSVPIGNTRPTHHSFTRSYPPPPPPSRSQPPPVNRRKDSIRDSSSISSNIAPPPPPPKRLPRQPTRNSSGSNLASMGSPPALPRRWVLLV